MRDVEAEERHERLELSASPLARTRSAALDALVTARSRVASDAQVTVEVVDFDTSDAAAAGVVDEGVGHGRRRDAVAEIERGRFGPRPDQRSCPACPNDMLCWA